MNLRITEARGPSPTNVNLYIHKQINITNSKGPNTIGDHNKTNVHPHKKSVWKRIIKY